MDIKSSAIVLSSLKYGDNGLIVKCYTETSGTKSFILKNAFRGKNKKSSLFTTLNQIKIIYDDKKNKELSFLKGVETKLFYKTLSQNPIKISVTLFIGEILSAVLQEEEPNSYLYNFISDGLMDFDNKTESYSDFHLWFLLNLTRFLGFYPHFSIDAQLFDLSNGISTNDHSAGMVIEKDELILFTELIQMNFSSPEKSKFSQAQRKRLLEILIKYYELHISGFRRPNSLSVLNQVFE